MYNFTVFYTCRYIYLFRFFIIINCDMSHVLEINYLILSYLIVNLFSNKYSVLYNSVPFEKSALDNLLESNENDVVQHCVNKEEPVLFTHTYHITAEQVKHAIHKLKPGKSDCIDGIVSDNFKNGTDLQFTLISLLFSAMLIHGIAPSGLLLSTLDPIPKNKRGNRCNSDNYRQIAISSILGKLFDITVLEEQEDSLCTDILQFGFKKQSQQYYAHLCC